MTISLQTTDSLGNPITSTTVGSTFLLQATVQDARTADATGVSAAYSDISYNGGLAAVSGLRPVLLGQSQAPGPQRVDPHEHQAVVAAQAGVVVGSPTVAEVVAGVDG